MLRRGPHLKENMLTRRTFAQTVAAGIGLGSAAGRAQAQNRNRNLHLSHLSLDDMIAQLTALKIAEIEMSRGEFMLMKPPTDDMCRDARNASSTTPGFAVFRTTRRPSKTISDLDLCRSIRRTSGSAQYFGRRHRRYPARDRRALDEGRPDVRNPQSLFQREVSRTRVPRMF